MEYHRKTSNIKSIQSRKILEITRKMQNPRKLETFEGLFLLGGIRRASVSSLTLKDHQTCLEENLHLHFQIPLLYIADIHLNSLCIADIVSP